MNVDFDQQDIIIELPPEGKDGRSIHPAGEWSADAEYHTLDLVSYNGSSYIAERSVPAGTLPTDAEYWQVMAEKGEPGASEWGNIAGNIADQTDLQDALNSKADASDVEEGFADVAEALAGKANVGDSYTKTEENALLAGKANADDVYTKTETDTLLADKADADDVYTKDDVDDALADKADSADVYTKDETDALLLDKAPVILSNASGSIASFTDGSPAPVTALSVAIDPVQDLHGYDAPWPAGGGANKFDVSTVTNQMLNISNGQSGDNANWRASDFIPMVEGSVTLTWESSSNYFQANLCCYDSTKTFISDSGVSASKIGHSNTFAVVSGTAYIRFSYSVVVSGSDVPRNNIRLNIGTSDLGYQPYSNICPISGRTSAVVTRTGKNLIEGVVEHALGLTNNNTQLMLMSNAGTCLKFRCKSGVTYTVSGCPDRNRDMAGIFDSAPNIYDVGTRETITSSTATSFTFTASKTGICLAYVANSVIDTSTAIIELGSTASAYEASQIQTVTIDLDGTRYGGELNVLTGEMVVDRAIVDLGTLTYYIASTGNGLFGTSSLRGIIKPSAWGTEVTSAICSIYKADTGSLVYQQRSDGAFGAAGDGTIYIYDSTKATLSPNDFQSALSGVQLAYPLATPFTVTLTPSQLQTLLGQNNLWADTGDTSVEYRADTRMYIDQSLQSQSNALKLMLTPNVETEMKASKNYTSGSIVIVNNDFLKLTSAVASGANLVIGSNCVKTTMAEWVASLTA